MSIPTEQFWFQREFSERTISVKNSSCEGYFLERTLSVKNSSCEGYFLERTDSLKNSSFLERTVSVKKASYEGYFLAWQGQFLYIMLPLRDGSWKGTIPFY